MSTLLDSCSESYYNRDQPLNNTYADSVQLFTPLITGQCIDSAKFYLKKILNPAGTMVAKLWANSSGSPGTLLATSDAISASTLSTSYGLITFTFSGANRVALPTGVSYWIGVDYTSGTSTDYVDAGWTNPYRAIGYAGRYYVGIGWQTFINQYAACFYVYGAAIARTGVVYTTGTCLEVLRSLTTTTSTTTTTTTTTTTSTTTVSSTTTTTTVSGGGNSANAAMVIT
jgi:hypothetical protein